MEKGKIKHIRQILKKQTKQKPNDITQSLVLNPVPKPLIPLVKLLDPNDEIRDGVKNPVESES